MISNVESADLFPGSSDLGVEYQCPGERHSASSIRSLKLDPLPEAKKSDTYRSYPLIVETCHRWQIPVRDYLASILPGFADLPPGPLAPKKLRRLSKSIVTAVNLVLH